MLADQAPELAPLPAPQRTDVGRQLLTGETERPEECLERLGRHTQLGLPARSSARRSRGEDVDRYTVREYPDRVGRPGVTS